jgi:histidine kinase
MTMISNYTVLEEVQKKGKIKVFRGYKKDNRTQVLVKILKKDPSNLVEVSRLLNEFEVTRDLDIDGIIKPAAVEQTDSYFAVIVNDLGTVPLKEYFGSRMIGPWLFTDVAMQLAEIISQVHEHGIVHRNLNPDNILIHPDTGNVYVTGFGSAAYVSSENSSLSSPDPDLVYEYISPEQTGRLSKSVDQRSDLYSLGVIFYELLTDRLPITAKSEAEWVHAHITGKPLAPDKIKPNIPSAISGIVMKLLEKNVEERYQSAYGLAWDIKECMKQLIETGMIEDFTIGQKDVYSSFQLPLKLYGRDEEEEKLKSIFDRVCDGSAEAVFISGYPGIGKTELVNKILKPLTIEKGYFISGKTDQLKKNIPYAPFTEAVRALIMQLMTESDKDLDYWRKTILNVLGRNSSVIAEIIPELEYITERQPPADELPPKEAENRFFMVFRDFINIFARKGRPLVIFLDDLQWADVSCIRLIDYLISEANLSSLLLAAAYRDNEIDDSHPLVEILKSTEECHSNSNHIHLSPLGWRETFRLVADTLHTTPENTAELSEVLYSESGGNPFFLRQLLMLIYDNDYLYFDIRSGSWKWDIEAVKKLDLNHDVTQLFVQKLKDVSKETLEIMKMASCIGSSFDLRTLSVLTGKTVEETASGLIASVHEGLILPVRNLSSDYVQAEPSEYRFLHDKVQQAVYSLVDENERKENHLAIGRLLLQKASDAGFVDRVLSIMDHFNRSLELIGDSEERLMLARYNLEAGRKARAAAAYESALRYFRYGRELLSDDSWHSTYKLSYDLYIELAQAEYLSGNADAAEELFNIVIQNSATELERAGIYSLKIILYASMGRYDEAVNTGITALRNLGVSIPVKPKKLDFIKEFLIFKWNMKNKRIEDLTNLPEIDDPEQRMIAELLSRLSTVTMTSHFDLYNYIIIKTGNHSTKHGNSCMASVGYFGYSFIVGDIFGDYRSSERYARVCIDLAEKYGHSASKCIIYFVVGTFTVHWTKHLSYSLNYMNKAVAYGKEAGDILILGYAHCMILETQYFLGIPLPEITRLIKEKEEIAKSLKHDNLAINTEIYKRAASALQGLNFDSLANGLSEFDSEEFIALVQGDATSLATYYFHKMYLNYMTGFYFEALTAARNIDTLSDAITGFMISAEYIFYYSLIITAVFEKLPSWEQGRCFRLLKKNQRKLKKWAKFCKENFLHKLLLVNAEMARMQNRDSQAMLLYDQAVRSAQENGFLQGEALANELAAKVYLSRGMTRIARMYMEDSCSAYKKWGALNKIRQLKGLYPELIDMEDLSTEKDSSEKLLEDIISISSAGLDKRADTSFFLDKAAESILNETDINTLLAGFLDLSAACIGADRAYLILNKGGNLFAKAVKDNNSLADITKPIPLEECSKLSKAVVRYAARTHETVIINCGEQKEIFDADPYIAGSKTKSIACLPLLFQGSAVGVLYFENSLMPGVFNNEVLDSLKLLTAQLACVEKIHSYLQEDTDKSGEDAASYLLEPLTEREMEVLYLIAEGMSNKEIAGRLNITINTVKGYVKNIYQKLGVNRRVQVIVKAKELNILK